MMLIMIMMLHSRWEPDLFNSTSPRHVRYIYMYSLQLAVWLWQRSRAFINVAQNVLSEFNMVALCEFINTA